MVVYEAPLQLCFLSWWQCPWNDDPFFILMHEDFFCKLGNVILNIIGVILSLQKRNLHTTYLSDVTLMLVDKKRVLFWVTKSKVASFFFVQRPRSNIPSWKLQFWHVFTNVFQESRKLVIAQLQNIVYNHFLPEILSPEILDKFGLKMASDSTYFPEANPTLKNEFSTAANRYGHSQIQVPQHNTEIKEFFCQWDLPWNQFWQMKNLNDGIFVQRLWFLSFGKIWQCKFQKVRISNNLPENWF